MEHLGEYNRLYGSSAKQSKPDIHSPTWISPGICGGFSLENDTGFLKFSPWVKTCQEPFLVKSCLAFFFNPEISTDPRDPWHLSLDISWIFTPQNLVHSACLGVQNVLGVRIRFCVLFPMSSLLPQMPLEVLWVTPTPAMILSKYRPEVGKRETIYLSTSTSMYLVEAMCFFK